MDWLKETSAVPAAVNALIEQYTTEGINEITSGREYRQAQAVIALALNEALSKVRLSDRKRCQFGPQMINDLLNGVSVVFMLGYDCAKSRENGQCTTDSAT